MVENLFTKRQYRTHFLPTYSPQLSPIEENFAMIKKSHAKRPLAQNTETIIKYIS